FAKISQSGLLNYYGPQRFGRDGKNLRDAIAIAIPFAGDSPPSKRPARPHRPDKFRVSVAQSALFNLYAARRHRWEDAQAARIGDVLKRLETGGLFVC